MKQLAACCSAIPVNIAKHLFRHSPVAVSFSGLEWPKSHAVCNAASISTTSPLAISRNRFLSTPDLWEAPSAEFRFTETAALLSCGTIVNLSSVGSSMVIA